MYVVKLRYKDSLEVNYANKDIIHPVKDIRKEESCLKLDWFLVKLQEARQIVSELINRQGEMQSYSWGMPAQELDYISIVEISHYEPKREYQVVDYREFK